MSDRIDDKMLLRERREFLGKSSQLMLMGVLGPSLSYGVGIGSAFAGNPKSSESMHLQIAKIINSKWSKGITLTLLYPKGCLGNLQPVLKEFHRLTKVKIKLREGSLDKISAEMLLEHRIKKSEEIFDLAIPATFTIPDLVESSVIENLTQYSKKYEPKDLSNKALYSLGDKYKGEFYGYQNDGDAYLMFYNKEWLEDENNKKSYEDLYSKQLAIPITWEELDRQIRFFHRPNKNQYGGSLFRNKNYIIWEFWVRLHSKGVLPFSEELEPQINKDKGIAALEELITISKYLEPGASVNGLFDNFKSFAQGNKYCNLGWGGTQKYLNSEKSKIKGKVCPSPMPGGVIGGKERYMPYFNWGWNYVVSSRSQYKELSYLFSLFASTPQISMQAVREPSGYFDPYREEHYSDPQIQKIYGEKFLRAHRESLSESIPDLYLRGQNLYLAALKQGVYAANRLEISPRLALNQVSEKWKKITQKLGEKKQVEQWQYLKRSYPDSLNGKLS